MRQIRQDQLTIQEPWIDQEAAKELRALSTWLDDHPRLAELVWQDLGKGPVSGRGPGRIGFSADQLLRMLVLKQAYGFSYRVLAFHLEDSSTFRRFCRLGWVEGAPSKSTLQAAFKEISSKALEALIQEIGRAAFSEGIERSAKVRIDSTVVPSNIHHPMDSGLLWDSVRVLVRLTKRVAERLGNEDLPTPNRKRRAKRRHQEILHARRNKDRVAPYRDLLQVTQEVVAAAKKACEILETCSTSALTRLRRKTQRHVELAEQVIHQARRRVLQGESVPASEKVVSIFEDHTDVIVKDRRETYFGHKICLTGSTRSLILDCVFCEGNPPDSSLATTMIERHRNTFGKVPRQAAFDGGFASKENLKAIKEMGVEDVAFSKRRGLEISQMAKSTWVYRRLRRFRAGIEGNISLLKRVFGLDRCTWRSLESFKAYVLASVVAFNLLVIARHLVV